MLFHTITETKHALLRTVRSSRAKPNEVKRKKYDGGGPGCFGTGPLAASACSEVPPCPPGTASRLFTFHRFPRNQILHFSLPFHFSPFPSLVSLSTHYPCTFPTALEGVRRRVAGVGEGNPSSALIGRNRRQLRSHWSPLAAAPAWGEGTDCSCGQKGVPKSVQLISLASFDV